MTVLRSVHIVILSKTTCILTGILFSILRDWCGRRDSDYKFKSHSMSEAVALSLS